MKVLFVTRYSRIMASARYRVYKYVESLAKDGFKTELIYRYASAFDSSGVIHKLCFFFKLILHSLSADIVFYQKFFPYKTWLMRLLRKVSKKIIYDFDDAMYVPTDFSKMDNESRTKLNEMLMSSDYVIVGNS